MSTRALRGRYLAALFFVYAAITAGAVAADWPTPEKLNEERLAQALLLANAVDKDFRPYDTPLEADSGAQYRRLAAAYKERFGERFDLSKIEARHAEGLASMAADRVWLAVFAVFSLAVVGGLLYVLRRYFGGDGHPGRA